MRAPGPNCCNEPPIASTHTVRHCGGPSRFVHPAASRSGRGLGHVFATGGLSIIRATARIVNTNNNGDAMPSFPCCFLPIPVTVPCLRRFPHLAFPTSIPPSSSSCSHPPPVRRLPPSILVVTIAVKDAAHVPNPCVYEVGGYEHDWMRFSSDTHCDSRVIGCASAACLLESFCVSHCYKARADASTKARYEYTA